MHDLAFSPPVGILSVRPWTTSDDMSGCRLSDCHSNLMARISSSSRVNGNKLLKSLRILHIFTRIL